MTKRNRFTVVIVLVITLLAVIAPSVGASRVSPWVGQWQTIDVFDGSTNTLNISFRGGASTYNVIWRETYFTLCSGDPGIGQGIGTEGLPGLQTTMEFICSGSPAGTFNIDFVYNSADDTIISDEGTASEQIWVRISPRPW